MPYHPGIQSSHWPVGGLIASQRHSLVETTERVNRAAVIAMMEVEKRISASRLMQGVDELDSV